MRVKSIRICPICGNQVTAPNLRVKTCSMSCGAQLREGKIEDRFWAKVDRSGGPDACWPWKNKPNNQGYGIFTFMQNGKTFHMCASRYALMTRLGPLPDRIFACHNCPGGDNSLCCNPDHLFPGTAKDNTRDMMAKGRAKFRGQRSV